MAERLLRDMENETRALPRVACHLDVSPMGPDNPARDRKPQACAAGPTVAGAGRVAAIEAFEDVWDILRADAFAGVTDGHFYT
jgi:hypothetical protein